MKKYFLMLAIGLLFLLTTYQRYNADSSNPQPRWHTISAMEAHRIMEESDSYILLDVRTEAEFLEKRIDGAILIPSTELNRAETELPDKNAVILIYCRSGGRSALAAKALTELGYSNVYDFGGIINWPYETVN